MNRSTVLEMLFGLIQTLRDRDLDDVDLALRTRMVKDLEEFRRIFVHLDLTKSQ